MTCAPVQTQPILAAEEIFEKYITTSTPVLLRGAVRDWPARRKWTPQFFCTRYPDVDVELVNIAEGQRIIAPLKTYFSLPAHQRADWYLCDWNFRYSQPELFEDFTIPVGFDIDWMHRVPRRERPDMLWIYIGHAGTRGAIHIDNYGTSAWLAVVAGKKRVRFANPKGMHPARIARIDIFDDAAVRAASVEVTEARMTSGDLLFVPAGSWHAAMNPTYCLSVTGNFLDGVCFGAHHRFWAQRWRGRSILTKEIGRLARMPEGADRVRLARHIRIALDQWEEALALDTAAARRLSAKLRGHENCAS